MRFDCSFLVGDEHTNGLLLKANKITVWVLLEDRSIIERHRVKHKVRLVGGAELLGLHNTDYRVFFKPEGGIK